MISMITGCWLWLLSSWCSGGTYYLQFCSVFYWWLQRRKCEFSLALFILMFCSALLCVHFVASLSKCVKECLQKRSKYAYSDCCPYSIVCLNIWMKLMFFEFIVCCCLEKWDHDDEWQIYTKNFTYVKCFVEFALKLISMVVFCCDPSVTFLQCSSPSPLVVVPMQILVHEALMIMREGDKCVEKT